MLLWTQRNTQATTKDIHTSHVAGVVEGMDIKQPGHGLVNLSGLHTCSQDPTKR